LRKIPKGWRRIRERPSQWGFIERRSRVWRSEGTTGIFGCCAMVTRRPSAGASGAGAVAMGGLVSSRCPPLSHGDVAG
jgi:hypothetical protein